MQKRTYLTIMPDNKKDALRAAGRLPDGGYPLEYDRSQKLWFAKPEADLEKIKAWLPENTVTGKTHTVTGNLTAAEEFAEVLKDAGFIFPNNELPEMDSERHRAWTEGDKGTPKKNRKGDYIGGSGIYQGYMDGRPAGWYQNHRASQGKVKWTSTGSHEYDPTEAIKQRALSAQKRWDREIASQADYTRIAKTLTGQWSKMPPAPDAHPYLSRKGVPAAEGVKLDKYENLVIPLRNTTGELRTLQYIKPDGTKNLKKGGEKTGNYFVVGGELNPQLPVLYAEGYATAASLHQATGIPVVMTVDAGNLVTVSQKLKALHPDTHHIILGEDDFTKTDNKGLNKAREAAAAIDGTYLIPIFTESERTQALTGTISFSDFNDIHSSRGLDAVRDQLAPVLDPLLPDWRNALHNRTTVSAATREKEYATVNTLTEGPVHQHNKVENMPDNKLHTHVLGAVRNIGEAVFSRAMNLQKESPLTTPHTFEIDVKRLEKEFKQHVSSAQFSEAEIAFTASVFNVIKDGREPGTLQYDWQGKLDAPTFAALGKSWTDQQQHLAQAKANEQQLFAAGRTPRNVPVATQPADTSRAPVAPATVPADSEQPVINTPIHAQESVQSTAEADNAPEAVETAPSAAEIITKETTTEVAETSPAIPETVEPVIDAPTNTLESVKPTAEADNAPESVDTAPSYAEIAAAQAAENEPAITEGGQPPENAPPEVELTASEPVMSVPDAHAEPIAFAAMLAQSAPASVEVATASTVEPPKAVETPPVKTETTPPEVTTASAATSEAEPAEENGFNFTFGRPAGDVSPQQDPVPRINLDELLQGLSSRQEDRTWIYALDGQDAFRDYGDRIVMASPKASENDRMILAALLSAKANQRGAVEITGSEAFILRTMTLIADHKIEVHLKNPQQREQFEALLKTRAENTVPQNGLDIGPAASSAAPTPMQAATSPPVATPTPSPASTGAPAAPVQPEAPELSMVEKETLRTGLTGKLLDAGKAPYQFDKTNTGSFYVQMRTKDGNKTFWGVELEQALKDSGKQVGDMVKLQFLGKKPVTVNVPVKDADGKVTGFEQLETHRNHWTVTPATDNRLLVADRHAVAPAELAAYDGNAFWQLQQQVIQAANLPLATPDANGHGLLYTGPDGKGQPTPETPPADAPVPPHSKAAGSVVMHALAADGELLAHLAKGHGDYLQGVIRHEGELRNVLARICTGSNGNTYLALNTVQDNGSLHLIGHASAVNTVKNGTACFDTFAFQMKGKDAPKFAVPLVTPEKIPPALHSKLGFSQAYTPPKAEDSVQAPRAQVKPAIQPQPM